MFASLILIISQFLYVSSKVNSTHNVTKALEIGIITIDWLSIKYPTVSYSSSSVSESGAHLICYEADHRPFVSVPWISACFNMKLEYPYRIYHGYNETEVFDNYRFNVFSLQRFLFGDFSWVCFKPLDNFCVVVETSNAFTVELEVEDFDVRYMEAFLIMLLLYFLADFLSRSDIVQLILGTISGILFFSFFICYVITRTFPQKPQWAFVAFLCSSGSVTVFFRWLYNNTLDKNNLAFIFWYLLITSGLSFVICYIAGPVENPRIKNVFRWVLQAVCLLVIYHCLPSHSLAMVVVIFLSLVSFIRQFVIPTYHNYQ